MRPVQRNALMSTLMMAIIAASLPLWAEQPPPPPTTPELIASPIREVKREVVVPLEDLRTIPQDLTALAKALPAPLNNEQQQQLRQQFHTRYFAPWSGSEPQFSKELLSERSRHLLAW